MPQYFFEIREGNKTAERNEGLDLPNADAAWIEATSSFGEMIRDLDGKLTPGARWEMKVIDDNGKPLFKLAFITEAL